MPILGYIPLSGLVLRSTAARKQYIATYLSTTTVTKSEGIGDLKDVSNKALEEVKGDGCNQTLDTEAKEVE